MRTCTARKVYKMTTDAPDEKTIIAVAKELLGQDVDSDDLGDAMGAFITVAEADEDFNRSGERMFVAGILVDDKYKTYTVTMSSYWELFEWDQPLPDGPFDHIRPEDIR